MEDGNKRYKLLEKKKKVEQKKEDGRIFKRKKL